MTVSSVNNWASTATTLSVDAVNVGDIIYLDVHWQWTGGGYPSVSIVGGGVSVWNIINSGVTPSNDNEGRWFWGVVTTTGPSTITATVSSPAVVQGMFAEEFTSSLAVGGSWNFYQQQSVAGPGAFPTISTSFSSSYDGLWIGTVNCYNGGLGGSDPGVTYTTFLSGKGLCAFQPFTSPATINNTYTYGGTNLYSDSTTLYYKPPTSTTQQVMIL